MKNFTNNADVIKVVSVFTDTSTSIILETNYGDILPTTNGRITMELINSNLDVVKREVIDYTTRTGDVLTGLTRSVEFCVQDDTATPRERTQNVLDFTTGSGQQCVVSLRLTEGFTQELDDRLVAIETDKLDNDELRVGLGANKVLVSNASGNEVEITGATGTVPTVQGDGSIAMNSPTVNINGLTLGNNALDSDDMIVYYDGTTNKKRNAKATTTQEGLVGLANESLFIAGKNTEKTMPLNILAKYLFPQAGIGTTVTLANISGSTTYGGAEVVVGQVVVDVGGRYSYQLDTTGSLQYQFRIRINGTTRASDIATLSTSGVNQVINMNVDCNIGDTVQLVKLLNGAGGTGTASNRSLRFTPVAPRYDRTNGYFTGTVV